MVPIFGSIVQNGKLADCALAFDKQLNKVDLPTLGNPTIPHFNDMNKILNKDKDNESIRRDRGKGAIHFCRTLVKNQVTCQLFLQFYLAF